MQAASKKSNREESRAAVGILPPKVLASMRLRHTNLQKILSFPHLPENNLKLFDLTSDLDIKQAVKKWCTFPCQNLPPN